MKKQSLKRPIRFPLCLLALCLFALIPVFCTAQSAEPLTAEEEIPLPLTPETAPLAALREVPGQVLSTVGYKHDDSFFYDVEVQKPNGTIFKIDMNAYTGTVSSLKIRQLGPRAKLPPPKVPAEEAQALALQTIDKTTAGSKPQVVEAEYKLVNGDMVHDILLKKDFNMYRVIVNAYSGRIISSKREK
jgi:uncharacterized membrane protein YkoI